MSGPSSPKARKRWRRLHCGARLTDLFVTVPARTRHHNLVAAIAAAGIPVHVVSGEVMDELAQTVTPQGLLAVCGFVDVPLAEVAERAKPVLVALLANVRDPGKREHILAPPTRRARTRWLRRRLGRPL